MSTRSKRPTMSDIAARAGVSQATVSLVLNRAAGSRVSVPTRRRVDAIAAELGYRKGRPPAAGARTVGLLIDELTATHHVAGLIEGARDEAALRGHLLSVLVTQGDAGVEAGALEHLGAGRPAGVLYAALLTRAVAVPDALVGMPTVLLNCHCDGADVASVVPDDVGGGRAATAALLAAGHRRVGMIAGEDWLEASHDRLEGYRLALDEGGVAFDPALVTSGGWTLDGGRRGAHALLALARPPTALSCFCDRAALGAYDAAASLGLRVPEDLSIVGFDDDFFAAEMRPALTTVVLPHEAMARWAVRRLLGAADGDADVEPGSGRLRFECPLVARGSIAPPR